MGNGIIASVRNVGLNLFMLLFYRPLEIINLAIDLMGEVIDKTVHLEGMKGWN